METSIQSVLIWAAFGLLLAVTAGVFYLTATDWRDRRRRERDKRSQAKSGRKSS